MNTEANEVETNDVIGKGMAASEAAEIMDQLYRLGGVAKFCRDNGIRYHSELYQSIKGLGTIKGRMLIAKLAGKKPSELWPSRPRHVTIRDDAVYEMGWKTEKF